MQQVKHAHALTTSLWTISGEIEDRYGLVFYPTYDSFFNLFLINFIITRILCISVTIALIVVTPLSLPLIHTLWFHC